MTFYARILELHPEYEGMRDKGNTDKADKLGSAMAQLLGQAAELARGE